MAPRREYPQTAQAAEPSTDRIRRIVLETLRTEDDDSPCERHSARLDHVEAKQMEITQKVEAQQTALGDGRVCFESLRKDIAAIGDRLGSVMGVLKWVGGTIGLGLLCTAGAALLWVLGHMGQSTAAPSAPATTATPPVAVTPQPVKATP